MKTVYTKNQPLTPEQQEVIADIIDQYIDWKENPSDGYDWCRDSNGYDLVIAPNIEPFVEPGESRMETVKRIGNMVKYYIESGLGIYETDVADYDDLTKYGELRWKTTTEIDNDARIIQDAWYTWDDDEKNPPSEEEQEAINRVIDIYNEREEEADGEEFSINEREFIKVFNVMDLSRHKNIVSQVLNDCVDDIKELLRCQYYGHGCFGAMEVSTYISGFIGHALCVENGLEFGFETENEYVYNN